MLLSLAPARQLAAASLGARIVPRRIDDCASERQARAAAPVGKVFRIRFASRALQRLAW